MRNLRAIVLAAMMVGTTTVLADDVATAPPQQPMQQQVAPQSAPQYQYPQSQNPQVQYPAAPQGQPEAPPQTVLLIPFTQAGDSGTHGWVSDSIQEDLVSATARSRLASVKGTNTQVTDVNAAIAAARGAGATVVVSGSYQVNGDQIRVDAQMTDVASGRLMAPLTATGNLRDLFQIEDQLANQVNEALAQPGVINTAGTQTAPQQLPTVTYGADQSQFVPPTQQPATDQPPVVVDSTPVYQYPDDSDAYYPAYPYAYTDYGYGYPGFVFVAGGYYGGYYHHPYYYRGGNGFVGGRGFVGRSSVPFNTPAFGGSGGVRFNTPAYRGNGARFSSPAFGGGGEARGGRR